MSNILIIDNNQSNLSVLASIFRKEGHNTQVASTSEEALTKLAPRPDLIILEVNMPDLNGFILCSKIKENKTVADVPIIFTSASASTNDKLKCFNLGAVDYIQKPYNNEEFKARVKVHLKIVDQKAALSSEVRVKNNKTEIANQAVSFALGRVSQIRDDNSGKHIEKIQQYVRIISDELQKHPNYQAQVTPLFINNLVQTCTFHDIGKIAIPDTILFKTEELNPQEKDIMNQHVTIGAAIISDIVKATGNNELLDMGLTIAKHHHERWDGCGYPDRLSSSHIPLAARITAVATMYDFLRENRGYKPAYSHEQACKSLIDMKNKELDPHIVDALVRVHTQIEEAFNKTESSVKTI